MQQTNKLVRPRWSRRLCPDTHVEYEGWGPGATGEEPMESLGKARHGACAAIACVCIQYVCVPKCVYGGRRLELSLV